jgi:hypothetical protein
MRVERRVRALTAATVVIVALGNAACTNAGAEAAQAVPSGKYNCYMHSASQPMPWEPGYGGAFEVPGATTRYVMNLTILDGKNYQYLNGGNGTYRHDAQTREISWLSGPFAGNGFTAAFDYGSTGRPVIFLEVDGSRAYCIGPAGA